MIEGDLTDEADRIYCEESKKLELLKDLFHKFIRLAGGKMNTNDYDGNSLTIMQLKRIILKNLRLYTCAYTLTKPTIMGIHNVGLKEKKHINDYIAILHQYKRSIK